MIINKPNLEKRNRTWLPKTLLLLLLSFCASGLVAQSRVIGLRVNGQNEQTAQVTVMAPGQGGSTTSIAKGQEVTSGTRLIVPPGTTIILQSPGGKQICKSTTGKTMEYVVKITPKSENHFVRGRGAQIKSTVTKSVGYNYRVNNGRGTTSAARGTEFTFTDMSEGKNEQAIITTEEGSIQIIDQIPVTIGGLSKTNKRGEPLTKSSTKVQNEGSGVYTSNDYPVDYVDYNKALAVIIQEINGTEDPEERADNLLFLGDLYLDMGQPQNAIDPFDEAMQFYDDYYGEDDLSTLEASLSLAEAFISSGNTAQGNKLLTRSNNILQELKEMDIEDLDYLSELEYVAYDDEVAYDAICDELVDIYGLLGWLFEIAGEVNASDDYYDAMRQGCN